MNIFCLDKDPEIAAQEHCDKHCVKMILECNQLLCTTFWMQDIEAPYKKTHYNHPSAIWARESRGNFEWLTQRISECKTIGNIPTSLINGGEPSVVNGEIVFDPTPSE